MDCFDRALLVVRRFEGGSVNDPDDPGGPTNHGITHKTLSNWRGKTASSVDISTLEWSEARAIFYKHYWNLLKCTEMPPAVAVVAFDAAVNQGPRNAARFLQRALIRLGRNVRIDGLIGPQTLTALSTCEPSQVVEWFSAYRGAHYASLPHFSKFGLGWFRRLAAVNWHAARQ